MEDQYQWLEEIDGDAALAWVRERNAETVASFTDDPEFEQVRAEILQALDADDRLRVPAWRGGYLYELWKDGQHPRGLWRRATVASYASAAPEWEVLLDLDALAAAEGENWVWSGATFLRPDYTCCMVALSRGGADATVVREFDPRSRTFVTDGFRVEEAKTNLSWIDPDTLFVATDFGPGSLTDSGYPRQVRRWRRGTPIEAAETVFEARTQDVIARGWHDATPGYERDFVVRRVDFFRLDSYLLTPGGELVPIDVPDDAVWGVHGRWLTVWLRSPWRVGEVEYPAGCLLAADFDAYLAGERRLTVLFEPDSRTALESWTWTRDHLILATLADVSARLELLTPGDDGWARTPLDGVPEFSHAWIVDTEPHHGNGYLLGSTGYLQPTRLDLGEVGGRGRTVRQEPEFFPTAGHTVRQFFAVSADGTRVPYFVVGDPRSAGAPTMLMAYGGFLVCLTPDYDAAVGRGWLARGGTYVVANIRGGGEFGPRWHQAALRDQRPRAYEDLAAVAIDLVARGITGPERLGVYGGSNGGLLTGVMLTRYPHLFGAVVAAVPLLDMRRYHLLLAGASWIAEYGDPDNADDWAFLREYSPYHNVRPEADYPPVLLTTSTRDDRVHPGHARKMAALLLAQGRDVRYYENIEGGHGGSADNAQRAFLTALRLRFLWQVLAS